jgi:SOS-response transcriptional repressor LexA
MTALLAGIAAYREQHGYPPSTTDMEKMAGYHTGSAVTYALRKLEGLGLLTWEKNTARTVRLTSQGRELVESWA